MIGVHCDGVRVSADHFTEDSLSRDAFLGGQVLIRQPRAGYRAATDPVFLAAAVPARAGQTVLDLGCGAGTAVLCLGARVPGLRLFGVEVQPAYAALARRNGADNGLALEVFEGDIAALPPPLRARSFDHVIANPPYFSPAAPGAQDDGRDRAQREHTPLALWLDIALRRCRDGGVVSLIHLAERLPDLLAGLAGRAAVTVLPLAARAGRKAQRVIVRARKGRRDPFVLLAPLVVHEGPVHPGDGAHFTQVVSAVMRDGAALPFGISGAG